MIPFFFRQMLAHNREHLLEHGQKLLGGLAVVSIHAELPRSVKSAQ